MSVKGRIEKLEAAASDLPPSGLALVRKLQRMPPASVGDAIRKMTDAELQAIVETSPEESEIDLESMSDDELNALIDGRPVAHIRGGKSQ